MLTFNSDDEEEEHEGNAPQDGEKQAAQTDGPVRPSEEPMSEDGEQAPVKPEPTEAGVPPPSKNRHSSHELYMYNSEELASFKKKELLADVALLDGKYNILLSCRHAC